MEITAPVLSEGGKHTDLRGSIYHFNDVDLRPVKRLYILEHPQVEVVRAWQGHKKEQKWFQVLSGSFKIVLVKVDNWDNPGTELDFQEFILSSDVPVILHVPGGYASGFKANETDSRLTVFSDYDLEESKNDDFRFDKKLWYRW